MNPRRPRLPERGNDGGRCHRRAPAAPVRGRRASLLSRARRSAGVRIAAIAVAVLAYSGRLAAGSTVPDSSFIQPRDRAFRVEDVSVDGQLREWAACPPVLLGCDTLAEAHATGSIRTGWSERGLFFAITVATVRAEPGSGAAAWTEGAIDLFIDVRPFSARKERYEPGVRHFSVKPSGCEGAASVADASPPNVNLPEVSRESCSAVFGSLADGWCAEVLVPWSELGIEPPSTGSWIAASATITQRDRVAGTTYTLGATDVEPRNRLDEVPLAISPVLLSGPPTGPAEFQWRADEVVLAGTPWLEVEVVAPESSVPDGAQLLVALPSLGLQDAAPFRISLGQRYRVATLRFPLVTPRAASELMTPTIAAKLGERVLFSLRPTVRCAVTHRFAAIEAQLAEAAIARLPATEAGVVSLLKACARETAAMLSYAPDDVRAPGRRFRSVFNPGIYDERIDLFLRFGTRILAEKRLPSDFPFRGFRSTADGEWIPVKFVLPWNYQPDASYPACIYLYGRGHHRNRADFVANDLQAMASGQYVPRLGTVISIVPFQRRESAFEMGGDSSSFIFQDLLPSLRADPSRIGIYGGSAGAPQAVEQALNHPDRFAWVTARAGKFSVLAVQYEKLGGGRLANLRPCAISLQAGDNDGTVTATNRELYSALRTSGVAVAYDEIPGARHQFTPLPPPDEIFNHVLTRDPDDVTLTFDTPEFGSAFWLNGEQLEKWGNEARMSGRWRDGNLAIETVNVKRLSVFRRASGAPRTIAIDGARIVPPAADAAVWRFEKRGGKWEARTVNIAGLMKTKGATGPADQVETRAVAIVYGTKSEAMAPILRERAFRVLKARLGPGEEQLAVGCCRILSDVEAAAADLSAFNLWLIGTARENLIVERLAAGLPYASTLAADRYGADTLFSYVYPTGSGGNRYRYIEIGNSRAAYFTDCGLSGHADIIVRTVQSNGVVEKTEALFDTDWQPGEKS